MGIKRRAWIAVLAPLLPFVIACNGGPVAPEDIEEFLTERFETQSIVFHYSSGDVVDADWQQRYHDWLTRLLGVQLPTKLQYYKYRDRAHIKSVTGRETNGYAEPDLFQVHSIFPHDGHEAAHVYSWRVGVPSDFFVEGIAVALNSEPDAPVFTSQWNGTHVYAHTQLLMSTFRMRALGPMLTTPGFRGVDEWTAYGLAGSFTLYLIEQHGLGPMLNFIGMSSNDDTRARIEANVRTVWGQDLTELEAAWRTFIEGWNG